MRTLALLYLAIAASVALAVPAPVPAPQDLAEIVGSLPEDDPNEVLGPGPGRETPPTEPSKLEMIDDAYKQIDSKRKRDLELEKRNTSLSLPAGYFYAFQNLNAATEHSSYKTYKSLDPSTPDLAKACTDFCDSKDGCTFCNLYTEKFGPGVGDQVIKCSLYALPSTADEATNDGQWRNGYRVTISNSYGFSKILSPTVPGWTTCPLDGAINGKRANPTDPDPYMGVAFILATDPSLCAAACEEKTAYNSRHPTYGTYRACNFFNFYILVKNSVPYKTVCSFYLIPFDNSFATNHGYSTSTDTYTISHSWGFTRNAQQGVGGIVNV